MNRKMDLFVRFSIWMNQKSMIHLNQKAIESIAYVPSFSLPSHSLSPLQQIANKTAFKLRTQVLKKTRANKTLRNQHDD